MKYLELKNTVEKLLDFMERYNLDDYNERLVKRTLNELLYVIDIDEIDLKKEKEINDILYSLFPPRGVRRIKEEISKLWINLTELF